MVSDSINLPWHISEPYYNFVDEIPAFDAFFRKMACPTGHRSSTYSAQERASRHTFLLFIQVILTILHYKDASLNQLLQSVEQSSILACALRTILFRNQVCRICNSLCRQETYHTDTISVSLYFFYSAVRLLYLNIFHIYSFLLNSKHLLFKIHSSDATQWVVT